MKRITFNICLLFILASFQSCELYELVVPDDSDQYYQLKLQTGTLTDVDGNVYKTVKIGTQWWMAENLRTTRYSDGTPIGYVPSQYTWQRLESNQSAYCFYDNNDSLYKYTLGGLYTWAAASGNHPSGSELVPSSIRGVCPDGWHLPSNEEWNILVSTVKDDMGSSEIGKKLKAKGWDAKGGDNYYKFSALATGYRNTAAQYNELGSSVNWWTATATGTEAAYFRSFRSDGQHLQYQYNKKHYGYSVRCVKN